LNNHGLSFEIGIASAAAAHIGGFVFLRYFMYETITTNSKEAYMANKQTDGTDAPLSAATVWALFKETDARMARQSEEADKRLKELEKVVKEAAEERKKTERLIQANAKLIGNLGNRFGEMVEHMVVPNLVEKFSKLGFLFDKASRGATIEDETNRIVTEIDITLENGDKVMIVEVKSKPTTEDVNDHVNRMEKVRRHADLHGDRRKFLGAVAGMVYNDEVRNFVLGKGFYVIEPSGDTFNIIEPKGEYHPREW
jgi:hypothetical protein